MSTPAAILLAALSSTTGHAAAPRWIDLAPGMEYASIGPKRGTEDRGVLEVVRVDPKVARLELLAASSPGATNLTASAWADRVQGSTKEAGAAVVVINAGMFAKDQKTHVGMMACGRELHGTAWHKRYASVLLFDPVEPAPELPAARIIDLDAPGATAAIGKYRGILQNLRLVRGQGVGVWKEAKREWSEAAIGEDRQGRLLLLFAREGHTMPAFNTRITRELGVVRAQHVEGGPEASLSIRSKALNVDRAGTYETGFFTGDNRAQWALPNVLAIVAG